MHQCFISEKDYTSICEQQPIGAQQFRDFCSTKPELKECIEFQEKIVSYVFHLLDLFTFLSFNTFSRGNMKCRWMTKDQRQLKPCLIRF